MKQDFITNSSSTSHTCYPLDQRKDDLFDAISDFIDNANRRLIDEEDDHSSDHLEFLNNIIHELRNVKTNIKKEGNLD